jgi:hypothetical protein
VSSRTTFLAGLAALASLQSGCSDSEGASGAGDCGPFALTEEEAEHGCAHLVDGPFGELASGAALDNLHMLYTVTLEQEGPDYAGTLTFIAREAAVHAFVVVEPDVPLRVLAGGTELCLVDDEPEGCDDLSVAHLVELERNQEVTIELGPTSRSTVRILGERQ